MSVRQRQCQQDPRKTDARLFLSCLPLLRTPCDRLMRGCWGGKQARPAVVEALVT